jgi:cytidylate kinase
VAERVLRAGPSVLDDPRLRGDDAADAASRLSAIPAARAGLLDLQRAFAAAPSRDGQPVSGAVLDGRDIGTVICPDAPVKLFVTATVEERARRRVKELHDRGRAAIFCDVLEDLKQRDARDSQRAVAPLKPADDAFLLDTSALDADQALAAALTAIDTALGRVSRRS